MRTTSLFFFIFLTTGATEQSLFLIAFGRMEGAYVPSCLLVVGVDLFASGSW